MFVSPYTSETISLGKGRAISLGRAVKKEKENVIVDRKIGLNTAHI